MSLVYGEHVGDSQIASGKSAIYPYERQEIASGTVAGTVTLGPWACGPLFRRRSVIAVFSVGASGGFTQMTLDGVTCRLQARLLVGDDASAWHDIGAERTLSAVSAHGCQWGDVHASELRIKVKLPNDTTQAIRVEVSTARTGL